MATRDETTQLESQVESYSNEGLQGFKNGDAMNEKEDKVYSNLTKKKYSKDADVLDAISGYSNNLESDYVLKRALTPEASTENKTQHGVNSTGAMDNSVVEYWSDEEYRYPPQMSLSPPPGQFRRKILAGTEKCEEKENEKQENLETEKNKEIKHHDVCLETHLKKRALKKTLSPIVIRKEHHNQHPRVTETISPTASTSPTAHQYNWKQRTPVNEQAISSPSFVRPTFITTPTINKENYLSCNELIFSPHKTRGNYSNKLSFDSKRGMMPKRQVSRSQSSSTASTLLPEIPTISKTQGSSKSISDFRQSSSIFGRLVKKDSFNGALDDRGKTKSEKERSKGDQQASKMPARNSSMGESAKRKIRRILSLN